MSTLSLMDHVGPLIGAAVFVGIMSLLREPIRQVLNALLVAGAGAVYISGGGFGVWELLLPVIVTPLAYKGLQWYPAIGIAWLVHAAWDLPHHFWGNPIWPFAPTSSWGCFIFDIAIAVWFLVGAPSMMPGEQRRRPRTA